MSEGVRPNNNINIHTSVHSPVRCSVAQVHDLRQCDREVELRLFSSATFHPDVTSLRINPDPYSLIAYRFRAVLWSTSSSHRQDCLGIFLPSLRPLRTREYFHRPPVRSRGVEYQ